MLAACLLFILYIFISSHCVAKDGNWRGAWTPHPGSHQNAYFFGTSYEASSVGGPANTDCLRPSPDQKIADHLALTGCWGLVAGRDAWLPQGTTLYYQDVFIDRRGACGELTDMATIAFAVYQ
ncbi:hypothetical protein GGI43DRAFT_259068 [Trichoderma evansii]